MDFKSIVYIHFHQRGNRTGGGNRTHKTLGSKPRYSTIRFYVTPALWVLIENRTQTCGFTVHHTNLLYEKHHFVETLGFEPRLSRFKVGRINQLYYVSIKSILSPGMQADLKAKLSIFQASKW